MIMNFAILNYHNRFALFLLRTVFFSFSLELSLLCLKIIKVLMFIRTTPFIGLARL